MSIWAFISPAFIIIKSYNSIGNEVIEIGYTIFQNDTFFDWSRVLYSISVVSLLITASVLIIFCGISILINKKLSCIKKGISTAIFVIFAIITFQFVFGLVNLLVFFDISNDRMDLWIVWIIAGLFNATYFLVPYYIRKNIGKNYT